MKNICLTLLAISGICFATTAQTITVKPAKMSLSYPGTSIPDTISATGLVPASGNITVSAPIKFYVGLGGTWDFTLTIPYSGGTLPPTVVDFKYAFSGSTWGTADISGGGATAQICMTGNNPTYQCTPTGVNEVTEEPSITVAPNPATNTLFLSAAKNITTITIRDILGHAVSTQHYNTRELNIDISHLPSGMYLLWINDTEVKKFIKE